MSLDIFIVNEDCSAAKSLALKLAGGHKPGDIVFVTDQEMDSLNAGGVERLTSIDETGNLEVIEIDSDKKYLFVCKEGQVNLDDVTALSKQIPIQIVRTR